MTNALLIIFIILIIISISIPILIATGAFSSRSGYINPQPFKIGYLKGQTPQLPIANLCNSNNTMYPIQPPYVNYSNHSNHSRKKCNCEVNIFNSPP